MEVAGDVIGRGRGKSKKEAEQMAAWDALQAAEARGGFRPAPASPGAGIQTE